MNLRERFLTELKQEGLKVQEESFGENMIVKIHVPFARMCEEAETVHIEMPLRNVGQNENTHRLHINCNTTFDKIWYFSVKYQMTMLVVGPDLWRSTWKPMMRVSNENVLSTHTCMYV